FFGYEYLTTEQLLVALLKDKSVIQVLMALQIKVEAVIDDLIIYIEQNSTYLPNDNEGLVTEPSAAFQRVIQRAAIQVESAQRSEIASLDVLVSILSEEESYACYI
ncbi:MAG: ATP-dependent Clp protease ATP-binding subunit ClpA, partial [Candidatus Schmidhempelia sp.]|nr:ATP-dependent Clp protease ATP-binding subunit ClpA [Candidatus Schmidhempelia sp.]